jgi:hypothetical protein
MLDWWKHNEEKISSQLVLVRNDCFFSAQSHQQYQLKMSDVNVFGARQPVTSAWWRQPRYDVTTLPAISQALTVDSLSYEELQVPWQCSSVSPESWRLVIYHNHSVCQSYVFNVVRDSCDQYLIISSKGIISGNYWSLTESKWTGRLVLRFSSFPCNHDS